MTYRIFPLSDNSLTVEFGGKISPEVNDKVLHLANFLENNHFEGSIECVAAYCSLTIFYNVFKVRKNFPEFATAFAAVEKIVKEAIENSTGKSNANSRLVEIPVCFDEEFAPDLKFIAELKNLSAEKVKRIFLSRIYRVFMLGFLPGFAYMGEVDRRIAAPRKKNPRLQIFPGSVGIADRQTGIYPFESPGGWQIIGRTKQKLFAPHDARPTFLRVGDSVKFREVTREIFDES